MRGVTQEVNITYKMTGYSRSIRVTKEYVQNKENNRGRV